MSRAAIFGWRWTGRRWSTSPAERPKFPALDMAKNIEPTAVRIPQLLHADGKKDKAAAFYWPLLTELFTYAANRIPPGPIPIAASIVEIDTAMQHRLQLGAGPVRDVRCRGRARHHGENARAGAADCGECRETARRWRGSASHWYKDDPTVPSGRLSSIPRPATYKPVVEPEGTAELATIKRRARRGAKNPGASVIDLGNGVAAIELHSKMNALGDDIVSLITRR